MFEILDYNGSLDNRIDKFIEQESANGTFLQTRNFLNYHPKNRFVDSSFILQKSGTIVGYFPGVVLGDTFVSHGGSTFGGPIIAKSFYNGSKIFDVLKEAEDVLQSKFKQAIFKITPALFANQNPALLEYALEHLGYKRDSELSSYTELSNKKNAINFCNQNQKRLWKPIENILKNNASDIEYRSLNSTKEFELFYEFLLKSKAKHQTKPVHTLSELIDLKKRLPQNIRFRSLWYKGRYVCGMMQFIFNNTQVVHYQYIAPDESFEEFHHTTPINIFALNEAASENFKNFSWGISTENRGEFLNQNLYHYKESFGAKSAVNVTFSKIF